jgi:hypothetical protein
MMLFIGGEVISGQETILHLLNECEYSRVVWRLFGLTDMTIPNLLGLTLRRSELDIRNDIIAEQVSHKQVLQPDVFIRVTIGKYAARLTSNNNGTNFAQTLPNSQ